MPIRRRWPKVLGIVVVLLVALVLLWNWNWFRPLVAAPGFRRTGPAGDAGPFRPAPVALSTAGAGSDRGSQSGGLAAGLEAGNDRSPGGPHRSAGLVSSCGEIDRDRYRAPCRRSAARLIRHAELEAVDGRGFHPRRQSLADRYRQPDRPRRAYPFPRSTAQVRLHPRGYIPRMPRTAPKRASMSTPKAATPASRSAAASSAVRC